MAEKPINKGSYSKNEPSAAGPSSVPTYLSELGTRIKEAADTLGTRENAAKVMGVSADQLARYMRGENEPAVSKLAALSKASGLPLEYLATGGTSVVPPRIAERIATHVPMLGTVNAADVPTQRTKGWTDGTYVYVPMFDVRAGAGHGQYPIGERIVGWPVFMLSFIQEKVKTLPENLGMVTADGPSMEPEIQDGSAILVDFSDKGRRDGIYVLRLGDSILVKEIQRMPGGLIRVSSRAPGYEPFHLRERSMEEENAAIIARVAWGDRVF